MSDYSVSGDFGEVRFFNTCVPSGLFKSIDRVSTTGWHKVNELYGISRPVGSEQNLLLQTVSGNGLVIVNGNEYTATPGSIIVIPRECSHSYMGIKNKQWEFYWIHYSGIHSDACTDDIVQNGNYFFDIGIKEIEFLFNPFTFDTLIGTEKEIAVSEALSNILHLLLKKAFTIECSYYERKIISEMTEFLINAKHSKFSLSELTEKYHYSKEHIIRLFKSVVGITPYHYWQQQRFKRAAIALENSIRSINDIALEFGYSNVSNFSKQFKEIMGLAPSEYRKLYGLFKN